MMLASNICLHLQQFGDNAAVKDITRTIVEAGGKTVVALLACAREHQLVKSPKVRSYKQDHLLVDPRERRGRGKKRGRWTFGFARRRRSHALQFAIPFFCIFPYYQYLIAFFVTYAAFSICTTSFFISGAEVSSSAYFSSSSFLGHRNHSTKILRRFEEVAPPWTDNNINLPQSVFSAAFGRARLLADNCRSQTVHSLFPAQISFQASWVVSVKLAMNESRAKLHPTGQKIQKLGSRFSTGMGSVNDGRKTGGGKLHLAPA
ncbi:hypothetical protein ACCO45_012676 [Purpureocillium lilacinum]|uniref:Uncharacterized protein n=1 Tax=Purpureocillium lilacinum TaxID=33203 RepID=A0ACC4DBR5_PURLI